MTLINYTLAVEATPAAKPLWRHYGHTTVGNELEVMVTEQVQDLGS